MLRLWKAREERKMKAMEESKGIEDEGTEIEKVLTPQDYFDVLTNGNVSGNDEVSNAISQLSQKFAELNYSLEEANISNVILQADFDELMLDYNESENNLNNFKQTLNTMPPNEPPEAEPESLPDIEPETAPSYLDSLINRGGE